MDNARKQQLREQYREMRPDMGIFMFRCNPINKVYLDADQNLQGTFNSIRFQLKAGSFLPNREFQKDWQDYGAEAFTIETLEILEYDKESENVAETPPRKTDYSADLRILKETWREKLTLEGFEIRDLNRKFRKK